MDNISQIDRHKNMSLIRSRDTKPELLVRKALYKKGFRYQLYRKDLPGKPDLVFPKYKSIILINGCFWHGHNCPSFKLPLSNIEYWKSKIAKNMARDIKNLQLLRDRGWRVYIVWECSLRKIEWKDQPNRVVELIAEWLQSS
jgi:DNA mismatch endonuclease (patch repair protein)